MPVEVLGLEIERHVIGEQAVEPVDQRALGIVALVGHDFHPFPSGPFRYN
jgi:hypothetical protein